jgi:hypothetical protein
LSLEHFHFIGRHYGSIEGGYFMRKKPLECEVSVYSNPKMLEPRRGFSGARNKFIRVQNETPRPPQSPLKGVAAAVEFPFLP